MEEDAEKLVDELKIVKDKFMKDMEELKISIRKDVIITELKDILDNNTDFYSLKNAIEELIDKYQKEIQLLQEENKGTENKEQE